METSSAQVEKFERFARRDDATSWLACAAEVVEAAELDWDDLGVRFGITVCASATSVLRLNVGARVLFDVRPDGEAELFVVHRADEAAEWADGVDVYTGFPQVPNSIRLVVTSPQEVLALLGFDDIPEKLRLHAEASGRALPKPDRHNPLVDTLLFEDDDEAASGSAG